MHLARGKGTIVTGMSVSGHERESTEEEWEKRVASVRLRLGRLTAEENLGVALEPEALVEARRLGEILREDEAGLEAHYLLGWLHAFRYRALPDGAGQTDKAEAIAKFAPCFLFGADAEELPEELLPEVARHAMGFAWALQHGMGASPSPALLSSVIDLWRRIATSIPPGEPEHAEALCNLSVALKSRLDEGGEPADLDEAVDAAQGALASAGAGHPNRPTILSNLAGVLLVRFERTGVVADLDDAIEAGRSALRAVKDPSDRASGLTNLGNALTTRFTEEGDLADLNAAIEAFEDAAALPVEEADKAGILHNLGVSYSARYERTGTMADLDHALDTCRTAVEAASAEHPGRTTFLAGLGNTSLTRFEHTGKPADLDRAINTFQMVLELLPEGHQTRALRLSGLGSALLTRYRVSGHRTDLEAAIEANRAAVREAAPQQTAFNAIINNLGMSLWQRFERTGDQADLDEAISTGRASARATTVDHVDRAARLSNVGMMLWSRFKHTGALSDLDAAIEFGQGAVEAAPPDHSALPGMLSNLGAALVERYERQRVPRDLDEAIRRSREAVRVTHADRPDRSRYLANLCSALHVRFQRFGSTEDLEEAIEAGRGAVGTIALDHPERPRYLSALSAVLAARFEETGSAMDLDDAVAAGQASLDTMHPEHPERADYLFNLGKTLQNRYERTRSRHDFDRALAANLEASRADGARPSMRIRAARAAASLAERSDPDLAANLLAEAVRLLPEVADRRLSRGDQQYAMAEWSGLVGDAAALTLAARAGVPADRPVRALQLLETGRGVLFSQALDTRSDLADLRQSHPDLADLFEELRDRLDQPLETMPPPADPMGEVTIAMHAVDAEEHRRCLVGELKTTLDRIRTQEGFADFARPPAVDELLAQAAFGPVVSFNVSHDRSDALLLTSDGIESLNLPNLTYDIVVGQVQTFHRALKVIADPHTNPLARKSAQAKLRNVLEWLWGAAAEPVLHGLGFTGEPSTGETWPRIWWAPGGLLSLLPLHAAGYHAEPTGAGQGNLKRRTVMDRVVSSYTSTIRALYHARRHHTSVQSVSRSLIVAMPTTPGVEGRLEHVSREAELLRRLLPNPTLLIEPDGAADGAASRETEARPTKARVLERLPDCGIVHFACHGAHDPADPSKSLLLLHDHESDPLTVASLFKIRMDTAQLAYLSACRTAFMESVELIDEAIHLTSAFQLAGFPHVIGTLWEINDEMAWRMAADFYHQLGAATDQHRDLDTGAAARALHRTVRGVRDQFPETPSLWAAHLHAGI
ncbi:Tetratricopeptide repeat-containing protein [Streptomyces sp. OK228]|nr:Tetratricopeptide repeat-containing protein [Streptomyces sp. OK228]